MDFEEMDLKRIREEYLHLPLREMAKICNCSINYVSLCENRKNPPLDYVAKVKTLVLEKRIQIIESIVANSEMNEGILNFLEESASNKS